MNRSFFILLCVSLALSATTGPSDCFSKDDLAILKNSLASEQKSDGGFLGFENTYFAVQTYRLLGLEIPKKDKVCEYANNSPVASLESLFYSVSITEQLGCGKSLDNKEATLKTGLQSSQLINLYHAISTVLLLRKNKHTKIDDATILKSIDQLVSLGEEDGLFLGQLDEESGSVYNAGLAFQVLARANSELSLPQNIKDKLKELIEAFPDMQSEEGEGTTFYSDTEQSTLKVTSTIWAGANSLASSLKAKVKISESQVNQIANYFLKNKAAASIEDMFHMYHGLKVTNENAFTPRPAVISLTQDFISVGKKGSGFLKARLTNILGEPVGKAKVVLLKATAVGDKSKRALISHQEVPLDKKDSSLYQISFLTSKPDPGLYKIEFQVSPVEKGAFIPLESATVHVKVIGSASVSDFQLTVADSTDSSDISDGAKYRTDHPSSVSEIIKVDQKQHLYIDFKLTQMSGKSLQVHQVFLRLENVESGDEIFFVSKAIARHHKVHISLNETAVDLFFKSGKYNLELIVGDSNIGNSFTWKIGTLDITFSEVEARTTESLFGRKPEIKHVFRQPDKRPPTSISFGFTIGVLTPVLILIVGFWQVGANLGNFPSGGAFVYALGFQLSIGSILGLFAFYWFRLNMVQTLGYLGVLAIPTFFLGYNTLNYLATSKEKVE